MALFCSYIWKPKLQILGNNPFLKSLSTDFYTTYAGQQKYIRNYKWETPIIYFLEFEHKFFELPETQK